MANGDSDAKAVRLRALAADARERRPDVRALARFAANAECNMASLGFAARVDFDRLLEKTTFEVPFGQSPFAFRRGKTFEERLREDGYAPVFTLLREQLGYDVGGARAVNLRKGFQLSREGMEKRAAATEEHVRRIVAGASDAPNLLDGAVFARDIAGFRAFFEADAVAAQFGKPIHTGEVKSFPTVDGQADPEKVGAAMSQAAMYVLLLRELVERVGGDRELASPEALLITPRNTGLQPTMTVKPLRREIDRAGRILLAAPSARDIVDSLPDGLPTFGTIANLRRDEVERIDALTELVDRVGTSYRPECLASCGMAKFCRERTQACGAPSRVGGNLLRLLPGIDSLDRAAKLAEGATPADDETPVAEQLARAARLRSKVAPVRTLDDKRHRMRATS